MHRKSSQKNPKINKTFVAKEMCYLIDAYNLLFRLGKGSSALKTKREDLIKKLNKLVALLDLKVTLIFDGADPFSRQHSREHFDALEIIYTPKNLSADTFILEKLDATHHPENYCIVTNDRSLANSCKALKAKHMIIEEFLSLLCKKRKKKNPRSIIGPKDSDREMHRLLEIFEKRLNSAFNDEQ